MTKGMLCKGSAITSTIVLGVSRDRLSTVTVAHGLVVAWRTCTVGPQLHPRSSGVAGQVTGKLCVQHRDLRHGLLRSRRGPTATVQKRVGPRDVRYGVRESGRSVGMLEAGRYHIDSVQTAIPASGVDDNNRIRQTRIARHVPCQFLSEMVPLTSPFSHMWVRGSAQHRGKAVVRHRPDRITLLALWAHRSMSWTGTGQIYHQITPGSVANARDPGAHCPTERAICDLLPSVQDRHAHAHAQAGTALARDANSPPPGIRPPMRLPCSRFVIETSAPGQAISRTGQPVGRARASRKRPASQKARIASILAACIHITHIAPSPIARRI
ncbi:hypothetical protein C8Q74DRAFT_614835 [Fomes fomentarius]|nr:hypothetical protein C8Q74DRAFT_614835 [Fomes fomentarius]